MKEKWRARLIASGVSLLAPVLLMLVIFLVMVLTGDYVFAKDRYKIDKDIKLKARAASVQILHLIPGLKASFADPLSETTRIDTKQQILDILEEQEVTKEAIEDLLNKRNLTEEKLNKLITSMIDEAIKAERTRDEQDKYESSLTSIERYGYESPSKTAIPLGALAPRWARFPERVLVVQKTERDEITAWEKEYEEDVLAVSETADVSPSKAKAIITTLRSKGYSIFKEEIAEEATVELLWFRSGWDEKYPTTLNWKVCIEGTETNIITGYDPRGILHVRPIPDGKRVYVSAGYFDLKDEFRPKSSETKRLEYELEGLERKIKLMQEQQAERDEANEKRIKELNEQLAKTEEELRKEKKEEYKRDISKATWLDVKMGVVKLEEFWMIGGGTGTYLGNMKVDNEMYGFQSSWGGYRHFTGSEEKGVILTNAHVATHAIDYNVYVSEDKEVMWIIYPGYQYVRYTQDSDLFGSPSQVLCIDYKPVLSRSMDCAIIVTTKVPHYKKHAALLGNSDNVDQGDRVIMVGNPGLLQKFATEGIISNKNYDSMKDATWFYLPPIPRTVLDLLRNANLWIDAPIGIGGTSGSAIWALDGKEQGKVIALHALGLGSPISFTKPVSKIDVDSIDFSIIGDEEGKIVCDPKDCDCEDYIGKKQIRLTAEKLREELFKDYSFEKAMKGNRQSPDVFYKENETFKPLMSAHGKFIWITGMSAGIPINKVKTYLQERGLDPDNFKWEGIDKKYWWQ